MKVTLLKCLWQYPNQGMKKYYVIFRLGDFLLWTGVLAGKQKIKGKNNNVF